MRENLRAARKDKDMSQEAIAELLDISARQYQRIEIGKSSGSYRIWDYLEDLFNIPQRKLREISTTHPDQEANQ